MSYRPYEGRGGFDNSDPYFRGRYSDDPGGFRRGASPPVEVIRRTEIDESTSVTPLGLKPGPSSFRGRGGGRGRSDSFRGGRGGGFHSGFRQGRDFDQNDEPRGGIRAGHGRGRGGNYEPLGNRGRPWGSREGGSGFGGPLLEEPEIEPLMTFRRNNDDDNNGGPPNGFQRRMLPAEQPKTSWEMKKDTWGLGNMRNSPNDPSLLRPGYQRQDPPLQPPAQPAQLPSLMGQPRPRGPPPPPLIGTASRNQASSNANPNPWNNFRASQGNPTGPYHPPRPSHQNSGPSTFERNLQKEDWTAAAWPNSHQPSSNNDGEMAAPISVADNSALGSTFIEQWKPLETSTPKTDLTKKGRRNIDLLEKTLEKIEAQRKSTEDPNEGIQVLSSPEKKMPSILPKQRTPEKQHKVQRVPPSPPAWAKAGMQSKERPEPVVDLTESDDDGESKEAKFIELSTKMELLVSNRPRWRNNAQGVKLYGYQLQFKHDGVDHTIEGKYVPNVNEAREDAYIWGYQRLKSLLKEKESIETPSFKAPESEEVVVVEERVSTHTEAKPIVEETKSKPQPLPPTPIFDTTNMVPNPLAVKPIPKPVEKSASTEEVVTRTPLFAMHRAAPPPPPKIAQGSASDIEFEEYCRQSKNVQGEEPSMDGAVEVFSWGQKRSYGSLENLEAPFEDLFKKYMDKLHMRCWLNPKRRLERSVRVQAYEIKIESFDEQFNTLYIGGVFMNDKYAKESAFETACKGLEDIFPDIVKAGQTPDPSSPAAKEFNDLRCKLRLEYHCFPELRTENDGSKSYCYSIEISRAGEKEVVDGIYQPDERKAKEKAFEFAITRIRYRYSTELDRYRQPVRKPEPPALAAFATSSSPKTPIYCIDDDDGETVATTPESHNPPSSLALVQPMPKKLTSFIPTPSCYNPPKRISSRPPPLPAAPPRPQPRPLLQAPPPPPPPPPPRIQEPTEPFQYGRRPPVPPMQSDPYRQAVNQQLRGTVPNDPTKSTFEYRFKEAARLHNLRYTCRVMPRYEGPYQIFIGEISYHSDSGSLSPGLITGESHPDQNQAMEDAYKLGLQQINQKFQALTSRVGTQPGYQQPPLPPPQQQPQPPYMAGSSYYPRPNYGPPPSQDFGYYRR